MEEERKIIEVYAKENKEEGTVSFTFKKTENSEIANSTLKGLAVIFAAQKEEEDEIEVEIEEGE